MWYGQTHHFNTRYARTALAALLGSALSLSAHAGGRSAFNDGYTALMHQDYDRSATHFTEAIESGQLRQVNLAIAYHLRGADYLKLGRDDDAIADFDQALALNPSLSTAYNDRAIAFRRKGDYTRAFADYAEAIRLMPRVHSFYLNRGLAYAKDGQDGKAITDYKQALYYKPDCVPAMVAMGDAHMRQGHNADALAAYRQAMGVTTDVLKVYPSVAGKLAALGAPPPQNVGGGTKPGTRVVVGPTPVPSTNMTVLNDTL